MKPLAESVIVTPLYEAERAYSHNCDLVLPYSGKNPMAQQGRVESVGPEQWYLKLGDIILIHPFVQQAFVIRRREYLHVKPRDIAGILTDDGDILPLPYDVVIKPDFSSTAGRPEKWMGSLVVPDQVFEAEPPTTGTILGVGSRCTLVMEGKRVLFPAPHMMIGSGHYSAGSEIGIDGPKGRYVHYTIPESLLLAILE